MRCASPVAHPLMSSPRPPAPSPALSVLTVLLALLAAAPACGPAGGDQSGGNGPLGSGGSGGEDPGGDEREDPDEEEEEPPPDLGDLEGFGVWPGSDPAASPGARLTGFVGYRNSPRIAQISADSTAAGGLYRRTWDVSDPMSGQNLGEDFFHADVQGMRLWLHVVGTPSDLSPYPGQTENEYGTGLPQFARYPPTDPVEWADRVLDFIADMETVHGVVPEYVEIWNEVERVEWFTGTLQEMLEMYEDIARRIKAVRPGLKVGGPALAGWRSEMGGTESAILALIRHADLTIAPLDFVSWHHYAPGAEIVYSKMPDVARDLADSLGLPAIETFVSEWNIAPSAEGELGPDFDGSHSAANYANFIATAFEQNLDGNLFFLDVDEDNDPGIIDLEGVSLGAMTLHGIKKPVWRVLEAMHSMTKEDMLPVYLPEQEEYNLRVFASREGDRTRIVVSNDVVTGLWMFSNRSRDNGMDPGVLYPIWLAAGGPQADEQDLINEGLTAEQAAAVVGFMPEVYAADTYFLEPRPVVVTILGEEAFAVGSLVRFDATHNAPAQFVNDLQDEIQAAEDDAQWAAADATAVFLTGWGYPYDAADILPVPDGIFLDWADAEGIPYGIAVSALKIRRDTLRDERFADADLLNSLPETSIEIETAAGVGLTVDGRKLRFDLEPDTLIMIDLQH